MKEYFDSRVESLSNLKEYKGPQFIFKETETIDAFYQVKKDLIRVSYDVNTKQVIFYYN